MSNVLGHHRRRPLPELQAWTDAHPKDSNIDLPRGRSGFAAECLCVDSVRVTRTSDPASGRHSDTSISTCSDHSRDFYIPVDAFAEGSAQLLRRILRELSILMTTYILSKLRLRLVNCYRSSLRHCTLDSVTSLFTEGKLVTRYRRSSPWCRRATRRSAKVLSGAEASALLMII